MSAFTELFGATLLSEKGKTDVKTVDVLKDKKAVGIYFSAHWCPPCRMFTPELAKWYSAEDGLKSKGMEIVFVSSDQGQEAFDEYVAEQPWYALPYTDEGKKLKAKLSKKFKVQGIPSFVILDGATGELITLDGREAVSNDPKGVDMPWHPVPLKDIMNGTEFLKGSSENDKDKKVVFNDEFLEGKEAIGLYFSAHWCPPCKAFTPLFGECYKKINEGLDADKKKFEVLYLSCDRSEDQFKEYFGTMPWMAMPFSERKKNQQLSGHFDISGIPALVILKVVPAKDPSKGGKFDLEVANKNATAAVGGDKEGAKFPWLPEPVKELDEDPEGIDEGLSLICMFEDASEKMATEYKKILTEASKKHQKIGDNEDVLNFFCASKDGRLAARVRSECKLGDKKGGDAVSVVMMDIGSEEFYAWPASYGEFTAENLEKFFLDYDKDLLEAAPMGA